MSDVSNTLRVEQGRIDFHHHILPPSYISALVQAGQAKSGGSSLPTWNREAALSMMDEHDIAVAVASVSSPGVYFGDALKAGELARRCNETIADVRRDRPDRWAGLGILPLPDTDGALAEIAHVYDTLDLDGVILLANAGGVYVGDEVHDPVLAELDKRGALCFLHPNTPPAAEETGPGLPAFMVDFAFDTTRAVANLWARGAFERFPRIRWVIAHAGGTVPYLLNRFLLAEELQPELLEHAPKGALAYLQALYYDTAISTTPPTLAALNELAPPGHVLFGTDYPYVPAPQLGEGVASLQTGVNLLSSHTLADVERENAMRLLPRFAAKAT